MVVKVSERFFRPAEVELLLGDPAKAKAVLGWDADKQTSVEKLCEEMVDADIELAKMDLAKIDLKKKLKVGLRVQLGVVANKKRWDASAGKPAQRSAVCSSGQNAQPASLPF